ncbi:MAG: glucoamylase family protein [Terriglobia bacterium]
MRRLTAQGIRDAEGWRIVDGRKSRAAFVSRWRRVKRQIRNLARDLRERQSRDETLSADEITLLENVRLLQTFSQEVSDELKSLRGLTVSKESDAAVPRAFAVATGFLRGVEVIPTETALSHYFEGIQHVESLMMAEIWALKPMLEFAILEQITDHGKALCTRREAEHGEANASGDRSVEPLQKLVQALHFIQQTDWKGFFEQNSSSERVLQQDPFGAYANMDEQSRQMYRKTVQELARHALFSEEEVARQAVFLAMRAKNQTRRTDSSTANRRTHVGYYLMGAGHRTLKQRIGYKPSFKYRILDTILEWPEVFFIVGVELTTVALVFFLLQHLGIIIPFVPGLLLLIPASHAAIGIVNHLTSIIVPPRRIPKLDFSDGIPADCTTLVAVPCLLLSEAEVRRNVDSLEIRYLANHDPHLHFALVTDSPDASQPFDEHDELVGLCSNLIRQLNQKYSPDLRGSFLHLHRHRVYNPSEGSWMGWERKRGKLMDLNNLLLGTFDSFPVKTGDVSVLPRVRYVITLDSDTKLPPGAAQALIGALAHPLNRAVVDPRTNIVVEGHAILQPRVSVSVESSRHSRLASIYSGQTGFDIYSQAVSDVYQDLFGEGSFTGKGIYEVETFQKVLGKRFPTNALLSHDLIEGAYARAGLASDIVVVDDYPSHLSAYSRRLHRWVRGDWQIMRWLLPRVPDYFGRRVPNPLTFISRWKIFDNLRRSMNDIGLFLLLILGWAILPGGPVYWTLVTLGLLLMPTYSQLLFAFLRIRRDQNWRGFLQERADDLVSGHLHVFVMLVFLPHQALVMMDAILRTLTRLTVTHSNLLEWETAAESELGKKKSLVETYLAVTPYISLATALFLAVVRPAALYIASPILILWLLPDFFSNWVNRQHADRKPQLTPQHESFLRLAGLRTWRYFREFSNAENHWLIPDNVQEDPPIVAARLSSTNLGLLFNAQLAAHELGYLTLQEYAEAVERTLRSAQQLPRHNGHFFNWYDIQTAQPLPPLFISTVDSGNLAACLWTVKQSCLGLSSEPLLPKKLWQGIRDPIQLLSDLSQDSTIPVETSKAIKDLAAFAEPLGDDAASWIGALPWLEEQIQRIESTLSNSARDSTETGVCPAVDLVWWAGETAARLRGVRNQVENLMPWVLPEYLPLFQRGAPIERITLASLPAALHDVENQVAESLTNDRAGGAERSAARLLQRRLPMSADNADRLAQALQRVVRDTDQLVNEMDFSFLYNPKRKSFSTGWNVPTNKLDPYYYDLLASEARTAVFIAAAKGEVHQEAWLRLGRSYTSYLGERLLLSWSGTMFEYLMPALWMRSHPDTIMDQTLRAAISCQMKYAHKNDVPWGISEAAFSDRNPRGEYGYRAFGVPGLAMDPHAPKNLVVSPYSSFLALLVEPDAATRNLEIMTKMGCLGSRGFYDSCDFTPAQKTESGDYEIIRCWMAHHQGMSLVALCNFLNQSSIQKWFHREPKVMATEMVLHERVALSTLIMVGSFTSSEKDRPPARHRRRNPILASSRTERGSNGGSNRDAHQEAQGQGSTPPPPSS